MTLTQIECYFHLNLKSQWFAWNPDSKKSELLRFCQTGLVLKIRTYDFANMELVGNKPLRGHITFRPSCLISLDNLLTINHSFFDRPLSFLSFSWYRPVLLLLTVKFHLFWPYISIPLDRLVFAFKTVHFESFGPSSLINYRLVSVVWTVQLHPLDRSPGTKTVYFRLDPLKWTNFLRLYNTSKLTHSRYSRE